jgi:hypothetical protein
MSQHQDDVVHFNHQKSFPKHLGKVLGKFLKFDLGARLRKIANIIRELEFALIQAEFHVDELMTALQAIMTGKVPVNLITPRMLQYIIKNVSLSLPDGYDLVTGLEYGQLTWYYKLTFIVLAHRSHLIPQRTNAPQLMCCGHLNAP